MKQIGVRLIILVFSTIIQHVICDKIYIVTSPETRCPPQYDAGQCYTLQQYVSNLTRGVNNVNNDISFEIEAGDHNLDSPFSSIGRHNNSFIFKAVNGTAHVLCKRELQDNGSYRKGRLGVGGFHYVQISDVTFMGCDQNSVYDTTELLIENVHFKFARISTLSITDTRNATLIRTHISNSVTALAITRSSVRLTGSMLYDSPPNSNGGGINNNDSDMIIEDSLFQNIAGSKGGAIRITNCRNRTLMIINSTFLDNTALQQGGGGAIYVNSSDITINGCKFVNNSCRSRQSGGGISVTGYNVSISVTQSEFSSNRAGNGGGSIFITDGIIGFPNTVDILYPYTRSSIAISQCTFTDNMADSVGGAIVISGRRNSLLLTQSSFYNNMAIRPELSGSGGAVALLGTNNSAFIEQTEFVKNEAANQGGAVYVSGNGGMVSITMSTFADNSAQFQSGGALSYFIGTNIYVFIDKCSFSGNNASYCGAVDVTQATITSSTFSFNRATTGIRLSNTWKTRGGGAVCIRESSMVLVNCTFEANIATESSGGVVNTFSGGRVEGCTFESNTAGLNGGAILHHGNSLEIIQTKFINNHASVDGGAVHGNLLSIDKAHFRNNSATLGGSLNAAQVDINESNFIGNRAETDGGAIFLEHSFFRNDNAATIHKSKFSENFANQGVGGAIFVERHNVSLGENTFTNNTASSCGAIGASWFTTISPYRPYHLNINNSVFILNQATGVNRDRIGGGGVMCARNGMLSIVDSNFSRNSAIENGGVMLMDNNTILIERSIFDDNTARGHGGVAFTSFITLSVVQSSFTNNQASTGDGGVFHLHSDHGSIVYISESSIGYNHAGREGGVFSVRDTILDVSNTSLFSNTALRGNTISSCDSNITVPTSDTHFYRISQSTQPGNCLFYDMVIRPIVIKPSTTVPTILSTTHAQIVASTATPSEVATTTSTPVSSISTTYNITTTYHSATFTSVEIPLSSSVYNSSSTSMILMSLTKSLMPTNTPVIDTPTVPSHEVTQTTTNSTLSIATVIVPTTVHVDDFTEATADNSGSKLCVDLALIICTVFTVLVQL